VRAAGRASVLVGALLAAGACIGEERMAPSADVAARLAAVQDRSTLRITTRGRKTGKPHTVPIWFLVEDGTVYLATLDARRDWVRNVGRTPEVVLDVDGVRVRGRATAVTDPRLEAHVRELLAKKYWMAWIGSWLGRGPARTFRVDGVEPA
jgi:hypothetical protein